MFAPFLSSLQDIGESKKWNCLWSARQRRGRWFDKFAGAAAAAAGQSRQWEPDRARQLRQPAVRHGTAARQHTTDNLSRNPHSFIHSTPHAAQQGERDESVWDRRTNSPLPRAGLLHWQRLGLPGRHLGPGGLQRWGGTQPGGGWRAWTAQSGLLLWVRPAFQPAQGNKKIILLSLFVANLIFKIFVTGHQLPESLHVTYNLGFQGSAVRAGDPAGGPALPEPVACCADSAAPAQPGPAARLFALAPTRPAPGLGGPASRASAGAADPPTVPGRHRTDHSSPPSIPGTMYLPINTKASNWQIVAHL